MKRNKLFYVSALSMKLACSSACSDEMVEHGAPPEADVPAVNDANSIELTSDEMTILRTMDGGSPMVPLPKCWYEDIEEEWPTGYRMLHFNWGWKAGNGYYNDNVFDTNKLMVANKNGDGYYHYEVAYDGERR